MKYEKLPSSSLPCKKAVRTKEVCAQEVVLNKLHAFSDDYVANQEVVAKEVVMNNDHAFNEEAALHQEDELVVEEVVEDDALNEEDELDGEEVIGDDALNEDDPLNEEDEVVAGAYEFTGHTEDVKSVACHPSDALLVLSGGSDDKAYLWKIASDNPEDVHEFSGHKDTISSVAFCSDGSLLACASMDGTVSVWTTSTGALLTRLQGPEGYSFEWVKWHPRRPAILAGSDDHMMWMWHLELDPENYLMHVFAGHTRTVTCGDFMPNGYLICSGSDDASLSLWCPNTARKLCTIEGVDFHSRGLTCLAITKDSKFIYTCSKDGSVRVVSIECGDVDGKLSGRVVGALNGRVVGALKGHENIVLCIGISAEGVVATGSRDAKLIIWDIENQKARHSLPHEGFVTCLAWLGDTRFVATGCSDGCITIWDSESGFRRATFDGHDDRVLAIAVSCDCSSVVSVGADYRAVSHCITSLQLV